MRVPEGRPRHDLEMTLERRGEDLIITALPIEDMALLSQALPLTAELKSVLEALLEGRRVVVKGSALEYRRYRRTAPLGIFRKFTAMERRLREMGVCVIRQER